MFRVRWITLALAVALAACQSAPSPSASPSGATGPRTGGSLTVAWSEAVATLAPYQMTHNVEWMIGFHLFDTLVAYDSASKKFVPGLADSWQSSSDGLTWTLKLRSGVTFSDGTSFNASTVKANLDWIVDPKSKASPFAVGFLSGYAGTDVVNDSTVNIRFKAPNGRFVDGLAAIVLSMFSPASVEKYGDDVGSHPVGTGGGFG